MRRWIGSAALLAFSACMTSPGCRNPRGRTGSTPLEDGTAYVAVDGDDNADGRREAPFRTLRRAIGARFDRVLLRPGRYVEGKLEIERTVAIFGAGGRETTLEADIHVRADEVLIHGVTVEGSLSTHKARRLIVRDANLQPRGVVSTLFVDGGTTALVQVDVECGVESCVTTKTATLSLEATQLRARDHTPRPLFAITSSVSARGLLVDGGELAQIALGARSSASLTDVTLQNGVSIGLSAVEGSVVVGRRVSIMGAGSLALDLKQSEVSLRGGTLGPAQDRTIAIAGGSLALREVSLESSRNGALEITAFDGHPGVVDIHGGTIELRRAPGIWVREGELTIVTTRIRATPEGAGDGEDAIRATGPRSKVTLKGALIETPSGYGLSARDGAELRGGAKILRPRVGGVLVEDGAGAHIELRSLIVEGCAIGSGVVLYGTTDAALTHSEIRGCREAGIIAGELAVVRVEKVRLIGNGRYGIASFGGAEIALSAAEIKGSEWATFASCTEGSAITEAGDNTIDGGVAWCR